MARTVITIQELGNPFDNVTAGDLDIVLAASDSTGRSRTNNHY